MKMSLRKKIIDKASSYVPMTYDKTNDIFCITDYYGKKKHTKIPYCCMFVWDIFRLCDASDYFYGGGQIASCTTLLNYYKKKHPEWVHKDIKRCKPGDLVFYQFDSDSNADHIGIFVGAKSSTKFTTVEGNTSNKLIGGSQSNGGWIMNKTRAIGNVMAFVSIEIYPEKRRNGCRVRKIHFTFPVTYDGESGALLVRTNEQQVETVALLQLKE